MRTRETEYNASVGEKSEKGGVDELAPIVALNAMDKGVVLREDVATKSYKNGGRFRLVT